MRRADRIAVVAAVAAAVIWGVKAIAIWAAGGLDESSLESPLFGLGLVAITIAFAALGVAVAHGRGAVTRTLAGIAGVLAGIAFVVLADAVARSLVPASAGWVEEEAGLWIASAATAALAIAWSRARDRRPVQVSA